MQRKLEGKQSRAHQGVGEPPAGLALIPPNPKGGGSAKRSAWGFGGSPRSVSQEMRLLRGAETELWAGGAHLEDDEIGGCQLVHLAQDVAAKAAFLPGQPGLLRVVEVARVVGVACGGRAEVRRRRRRRCPDKAAGKGAGGAVPAKSVRDRTGWKCCA